MKRSTIMLLVLFAGLSVQAQVTGDNDKVLVLLAHPDLASSKANKAMAAAGGRIDGVRVMDIYAETFSPDNYRSAVAAADVLVFQFPFYWASAPSQMKRWIDEIFSALQDEIKGKKLLVATTTGSGYEAYRSGGRNHFTLDELLRPYQLTANHSGMVWQTPFVLYAAGEDGNVRTGAEKYAVLLRSYL